jgi:hypothetical protein
MLEVGGSMRPLLTMALVGSWGCIGEKSVDGDDDDDDGGDDTEVETTTVETGDALDDSGTPQPPGFLEVTQLFIDAELGWDAAIRQVVEVDGGGFVVEPALYLVLGTQAWRDAGWDLDLDDEYCVIVLPMTSSAPAPWATADATVWFGVDYVEGLAGALTDCNTAGKELDPAVYGEDPVSTFVEGYGPWGLGIGEWGPSWTETWVEYFPDDDFLDRYVGARVQSGFGLDIDDFRAFPVQIDEDTYAAQVVDDLYVGIPPGEVQQVDTIATGWYRFHSMWVYGITP